jgi:hypothetical protein
MWTRFFDMHSGGGRKTPFECIYIEAEENTPLSRLRAHLQPRP